MIRFGVNSSGNQRYQCKNSDCDKSTFLLEYSRNGDRCEIKEQIIDMALNGSGIRNTAMVLDVSMNTVMSELKKEIQLETMNKKLLEQKQEEKG